MMKLSFGPGRAMLQLPCHTVARPGPDIQPILHPQYFNFGAIRISGARYWCGLRPGFR